MADHVHQVRALLRDESNLREAIRRDQELRYDRQTAGELRDRLDDLLESITAIARDDELWRRLADAADEPLSDAHLDTFVDLAAGDLARLLETFGYRCPPPPPVDDLVDRTIDALGAARAAQGNRRELIHAAQWHLITFGMRVREQIELTPPIAGPSTVRRMARRACSVARQLAPFALAAAVGISTGTALVGLVAIPVAKIAEKVAEHGVKLAAEAMIGWIARRRADDSPNSKQTGVSPTYTDPLILHVTAVFSVLGRIRTDVGLAVQVRDDAQAGTTATENYERHLAKLRRHAQRISDLLEDRQFRSPQLNSALYSLDQAIIQAFEAGNCLYRNPNRMVEAAECLDSAARELHDALDRIDQAMPQPANRDEGNLSW